MPEQKANQGSKSPGGPAVVPVVKPQRNRSTREPVRDRQVKGKPRGNPKNQQQAGNARHQKHQQPLGVKHRWSKSDLSIATRGDLTARVAQLQQQVEELQRRLKQRTSTVKLGGTIANGRKVVPFTKGGLLKSTPPMESSTRSLRSAARPAPGKLGGSAPNVAQRPSVGEVKTQPRSQVAGPSKPGQSSVINVNSIQEIGKVAQSGQQVSPELKSEPAKARQLPRYAGASYAATVAMGNTVNSEKPILAENPSIGDIHQIIKRSEKRKIRWDGERIADEELVYFLRQEFAFKERTQETFALMHTTLRKHLRTYDVSNFTQKQVYEMSLEAVVAAYTISDVEQRVRAGMKDEKTLQELVKNNKFVNEGVVGHTGFLFKKTFSLPKRSK